MKILNKIKYILFLSLVFIASACDEGFDELNEDPDSPTIVPPGTLFNNGVFALGSSYWDRAWNFEFSALMVQHLAQDEFTTDQNYNIVQSEFDYKWENLYTGVVTTNPDPEGGVYDLYIARQEIEKLELTAEYTAEIKANQLACIDICTAFGFQMITDLWGDVPYSEAFQLEEYIFPAYDSQEDIYEDLISSVTSAVASINASHAGFGSNDPLFGGEMSSWVEFGNAMLIRLGMRLSETGSSFATTAIQAGFSGDLPSTDVMLVFDASSDNVSNPFYRDAVVGNRDDFRISEILVTEMEAVNDPRLVLYAEPAPGSTDIIGMPYGLDDGDAFDLKASTSDLHSSIEGDPSAPAYLFSLAEIEFFRAEAIAREIIAGDAEAAYEDAITASMRQWGVAEADITAYLAETDVVYDASSLGTQLQSIAEQKWIALYTNGVEAYAEWRRLDLPDLTVGPASVLDKIPVRMLYSISESTSNPDNYNAAGPNTFSEHVWWDIDDE